MELVRDWTSRMLTASYAVCIHVLQYDMLIQTFLPSRFTLCSVESVSEYSRFEEDTLEVEILDCESRSVFDLGWQGAQYAPGV